MMEYARMPNFSIFMRVARRQTSGKKHGVVHGDALDVQISCVMHVPSVLQLETLGTLFHT